MLFQEQRGALTGWKSVSPYRPRSRWMNGAALAAASARPTAAAVLSIPSQSVWTADLLGLRQLVLDAVYIGYEFHLCRFIYARCRLDGLAQRRKCLAFLSKSDTDLVAVTEGNDVLSGCLDLDALESVS